MRNPLWLALGFTALALIALVVGIALQSGQPPTAVTPSPTLGSPDQQTPDENESTIVPTESEDDAPPTPIATPDPDALSTGSGTLIGEVLGTFSRQPQTSVEVWLGTEGSEAPLRTTMTDNDGRFSMGNLPAGVFLVHCPRHTNTETTVVITEEEPSQSVMIPLPESITLEGTVIDADSGRPLPDFEIRGWALEEDAPTEAMTDTAGRFLLPGILAGGRGALAITLESTDPNWLTEEESTRQTQILASAEEAQSLVFAVRQGRRLEIWTVDPDRNPVEGATVLLMTSDLGQTRSLGITGSGGHLATTRPQGFVRCQVVGWHPDWPMMRSPILEETDTQAVVQADRVVDLEVEVVDTQGQPVPGADLRVASQSDLEILGTTTGGPSLHLGESSRVSGVTDGIGMATFPRRPAVLHTVFAIGPEIEGAESPEARETVDLSQGGSPRRVTITLRMPEGMTISGRVLDVQDRPIGGAIVAVMDGEGTPVGGEGSATQTDSNGRFEVTGPPQMSALTLAASAEGYAPSGIQRAFGDQRDVVIRLTPRISIRGRVAVSSREADDRFALLLWCPTLLHQSAGWRIHDLVWVTSGQGRTRGQFEWILDELPDTMFPGPVWVLAMTTEGQAAVCDLTLTADSSQIHDLETMSLESTHRFEGHVVSITGEPLVGAQVQWEQATHRSDLEDLNVVWSTETDDLGDFTLERVPAGHWRIGIEAQGHDSTAFEIDVPSSAGRTFTLNRDVTADVTFEIRDELGLGLAGATTRLHATLSDWQSEIVTGDDGKARHWGVETEPHRYSIAIPRPGMEIWISRVTPVDELGVSIVWDLSQWPTLMGHFTRSGRPIRGLTLSLEDDEQTTVATCVTDDNGFYRLRLPAGSYRLWGGENVVRSVELERDVNLNVEATAAP